MMIYHPSVDEEVLAYDEPGKPPLRAKVTAVDGRPGDWTTTVELDRLDGPAEILSRNLTQLVGTFDPNKKTAFRNFMDEVDESLELDID
jgi:hypothetical protein